jgi:hypothetical protein
MQETKVPMAGKNRVVGSALDQADLPGLVLLSPFGLWGTTKHLVLPVVRN